MTNAGFVHVYLTFYCDCGAAYLYRGARLTRDGHVPGEAEIVEDARRTHLADGHTETTAAGASGARLRNDRRAPRQEDNSP
mgnify:CR=1 FL=1